MLYALGVLCALRGLLTRDCRMSNNLAIKIGDVAISIEGQVSGEIAPAYLPFICQGKTDISLRLHLDP